MAGSVKATTATVSLVACLARSSGQWRYGYDLLAETGLKSGSLYPMLRRLAERGLLDAAWESSPPLGRPPRHMYRLTAHGQAWLCEIDAAQVAHATRTVRTGRAARPAGEFGGAV